MVARAPRCAIFPGGDGCETFALLLAGGLVLLGHFPGGTHHVGLKNPGVRAKAANHFNHLELRQIFTACRRFCCTRGILLRFQPRHHQLLIRQPGLHAGRHFCAQFNQGPDDFLAAAAKGHRQGGCRFAIVREIDFCATDDQFPGDIDMPQKAGNRQRQAGVTLSIE